MLVLLGLVPSKAVRLVSDSVRVVQDALLDSQKSGKQFASDGGWDAASLSRQFHDYGLNFAGIYTALWADRHFALAFVRRLCVALRIDVSELAGMSDTHALAARVARLEALAAGQLNATTVVDVGSGTSAGLVGPERGAPSLRSA